MPQRPILRLFHNLARSGGTMVCKCIGAMDSVRLFSEIHPKANHVEYLNLVDQAHRWYQLVDQKEVEAKHDFVKGAHLIQARCQEGDLEMVIRDWAVIDFLGKVLVNEPTYEHQLAKVLENDFELKRVFLVRHPLDQWLSVRRLKIYANKLTASEFFLGYRRFAESAGNCAIRYEDFTESPEQTMRRISEHLAVRYDAGFIDRWYDNTCITGDNKHSSRGSQGEAARSIRPIPRREVDATLKKQVEEDDNYQSAIRLLGYTSDGV